MTLLRRAADLLFDVYLFPANYQLEYRKPGDWIAPINLLLGWTVIGWMVCAVWVLATPREKSDPSQISIPQDQSDEPSLLLEQAYAHYQNMLEHGSLSEIQESQRTCERIAKQLIEKSEEEQ